MFVKNVMRHNIRIINYYVYYCLICPLLHTFINNTINDFFLILILYECTHISHIFIERITIFALY